MSRKDQTTIETHHSISAEDSFKNHQKTKLEPWKILIADDDEQTHLVTKLALSDIKILEQDLEFFHAYNSKEAYSILQEIDDMTIILLDIVMETETAGLDLVHKIRDELKMDSIRIIIRAAQSSIESEVNVIQDYDINDFKMKSELTQDRLISALTTAVRSYKQYKALEKNRIGMEYMINGSAKLNSFNSVEDYSSHVISQVNAVLSFKCESFLCNYNRTMQDNKSDSNLFVVAASPYFRKFYNLNINNIESRYKYNLEILFQSKTSFSSDREIYIYLENEYIRNAALIVKTDHKITDSELQLLKLFSVQVSIGLGNQYLLQELHSYAYFDHLCQIPNRTSFLAEIEQRKKIEAGLIVVLVDIDNFSEINITMGYQNGDVLLKLITRRLISRIDKNIMLARIGGDSFSIIGSEKRISPELLLNCFNEPFVINGTSFPIKATLGLANILPDNSSSEDILMNADMAMKIAKNSPGTQFKFFNENMNIATQNRISITRDLRSAIDNDELVLHFQPQLNLESEKFIGVESLIRWQKPNGRLIPPSEFIHIAEQSGLIIDIGEIALKKSFIFLKKWIDRGNRPFRMGINVSVRQFHSDNFSQYLTNLLLEYPIDPSFIELEITESMLMHDVDLVVHRLNHAKDLGFSVAIDDFGTGFSSLNYLLRLPIDRLKIDRSFIINLENDPKAQKLTKLIISMGKELNLGLIAEGVETREQADFLKKLKCDEVQGYLFGKPLDESDFTTRFKTID